MCGDKETETKGVPRCVIVDTGLPTSMAPHVHECQSKLVSIYRNCDAFRIIYCQMTGKLRGDRLDKSNMLS